MMEPSRNKALGYISEHLETVFLPMAAYLMRQEENDGLGWLLDADLNAYDSRHVFMPTIGGWLLAFDGDACHFRQNLRGLGYIRLLLSEPSARTEGIPPLDLETGLAGSGVFPTDDGFLLDGAETRQTMTALDREYSHRYRSALRLDVLESLDSLDLLQRVRHALDAGVWFSREEKGFFLSI